MAIGSLTGCVESSNEYVSGHDLIEDAKLKAEQEVEENRITRKEEFDKHYRNGLYFEDFGDTAKKLNDLMTPVVQEKYASLPYWPVVARSNMEFYNLTLKQYRDEQLSFEEIVANPEEYIRNWSVWLYYFVDYKTHSSTERIEWIEHMENDASSFVETGGAHAELHIIWCEDEFLSEYSVDEATKTEDIQSFLVSYAEPYDYYYITESDFSANRIDANNTLIELPLGHLYEKYHEEFKMIGLENDNIVCVPVNNPSLKFQLDNGDRYLSVLVQSIMTEKAYELIEEEGMTGKIIPFVMPTDNTYTMNSMNKLAYNTGEGFDSHHFIENVYEGNYDFSLYYLVDEEADIDYAMLQRLMGKIYDIPYNTWDSVDERTYWDKNIFTFFYKTTKEDRDIISKLFKEDAVTGDGFPVRTTMANVASTMDSVRSETDGFAYLDVYCSKLPFIVRSGPDPMGVS